MGSSRAADRSRTEIDRLRKVHGLKKEVKWKRLNSRNFDAYIDLVDTILGRLDTGDLVFRQMFVDRSFRATATGDTELDVQFKLYYQFLKHMFDCQTLPPGERLRIRLDGHSSQRHKDSLKDFAENLPRLWERRDVSVALSFDRSSRVPLMQMADLFMGAAGSHGNLKHQLRAPGQRGMSEKQKLRHAMATHIYSGLRLLDSKHRGTKAFNWFESTGDCPDGQRQAHPVRIWKFKPREYVIDHGWRKKALDRQGRYLGPQIDPVVRRL